MKRIALLTVAAFALTGCASSTIKKVVKNLNEFEKLDITEITVTGKFSNTEYKVEETSTSRRSTVDHTNPWIPKIRVVRDKKK
jgi:PBP1b-binding outer membrane lipoprotein LpoB